MNRQPYRTPGVTQGRGGRPFSYTRHSRDDEEEEEGLELDEVGPQRTREQLVFDRESGKLVVKEERPKPVASGKVVLTGIASSGFF